MLQNTLNLVSFFNADGSSNGTAQVRPTVIIEGPINHKTTRGSTDGRSILSIGHTITRENAGQETQRSVVRLEEKFLPAGSVVPVTAYIQQITSVPRNVVTVAQLKRMFYELQTVLLVGESANGSSWFDHGTYASTNIIPRLYAGEP